LRRPFTAQLFFQLVVPGGGSNLWGHLAQGPRGRNAFIAAKFRNYFFQPAPAAQFLASVLFARAASPRGIRRLRSIQKNAAKFRVGGGSWTFAEQMR
jgi:hypothetical protein